MKSKIGLNDLKLLVDVMNSHEKGQPDHLVSIGFCEASKRLQRAGLIIENPTNILPLVQITGEGHSVIDDLLNRLSLHCKKRVK